MRRYNERERQFLRENIPGRSYIQTAELFNAWNESLPLVGGESRRPPITVAQVKSFCGNNAICTDYKGNYVGGNSGSFQKGQVPHNKGKPMPARGRTKETQFKKGQMPKQHRPVGSTRVGKDGYIEIKVAEPRKWHTMHRAIWEKANGPTPKGCVVIFGDGDKRNFDLNNLILVTRAQLARLNQQKLIGGSAELTKTGVIVADLLNKIGEKKRVQRRSGDS